MNNNIKEFYIKAANNFTKPPKPLKNNFELNLCELPKPQLYILKKEVSRELRHRNKIKFRGFWNRYKQTTYAIITLIVAIIGGIIIPIFWK